MNLTNKENKDGFILLPVLMVLGLIGLCTYMLNRSQAIEGRIAASQNIEIKARYIAEAGMRHFKWLLYYSCNATIPGNIPFGDGHSYSVELLPLYPTPTAIAPYDDVSYRLKATGVFNGQSSDNSTHFKETIMDDCRCLSGPYWSEGGKVYRFKTIDGTTPELQSGIDKVTFLKYDPLMKVLFWSNDNHKEIWQEGASNPLLICSGSPSCGSVYGLALDPEKKQIYLVDQNQNEIRRVGYDGTPEPPLINGLTTPWDIDLDLTTRTIYWVEAGSLSWASMDDPVNNKGQLLSGDPKVTEAISIAVDSLNKSVYWFNNTDTTLYTYDLTDGTTKILVGPAEVTKAVALALDLHQGKIYWADNKQKKIRRANLDPSNPSPEDVGLLSKAPEGVTFVHKLLPL